MNNLEVELDLPAKLTATRTRVAVILVNWNGWRECIECIDSLLAQDHRDFHIFVVDNESGDGSIERLAEWCAAPEPQPGWQRQEGVARYTDTAPHRGLAFQVSANITGVLPTPNCPGGLSLIRAGGNLGFAGGCNVGIKAAGLTDFDYFWLLNPDTVVERRSLSELIARAEVQPAMGLVGSTLLFYDRPGTVYALGGGRLNRSNGSGVHIGQGVLFGSVANDLDAVEGQLSWICGASMLVSTRFVREVGLMTEDYFLYYEELDWAMRGVGKFRLGFAPKSIVFHKSGANSSKVMPLFTAGFYYRSRLRFVKKFLPDRLPAARRGLFVEMLKHLARGRWSSAWLVAATLFWTPAA